MDKFIGSFKMATSENLNAYLKAMGKHCVVRCFTFATYVSIQKMF